MSDPKKIFLNSTRFVPPPETARVFQEAALALAKNPDILCTYVDPSGLPELKDRIAAMTPTWEGDIVVTPSGTYALSLALREIQAGGARKIAIKIPAYYGVLNQAGQIGLEIEPWESIEDLEALGPIDAILLSSNFTPPEGKSFSPEDKACIARIAEKNGAWIVEDNPYDPIWYGNRFPDPIEYDPARIIRTGSLSKVLGAGVCTGFIRAELNIVERLLARMRIDGGLVNAFAQALLAHMLTDDVLVAFRSEMRERTVVLADAIERETGIVVPRPEGGLFLRLDLPEGTSAEEAQAALARQNVTVDTNERYYPDGKSRPYLRLSIGAATQEDLREVARRIAVTVMSPKMA